MYELNHIEGVMRKDDNLDILRHRLMTPAKTLELVYRPVFQMGNDSKDAN